MLAGQITKSIGSAMAIAHDSHAIIIGVEAAGVILGCIQARDDMLLLVKHLHGR